MQTDVYLTEQSATIERVSHVGVLQTIQPALFPYERPRTVVPSVPQEKNGVVYTKPWVVDLILDLVGYTVERPLHDLLLIEPSAGDGSFLLRAAGRLAESCARNEVPLNACRSAI